MLCSGQSRLKSPCLQTIVVIAVICLIGALIAARFVTPEMLFLQQMTAEQHVTGHANRCRPHDPQPNSPALRSTIEIPFTTEELRYVRFGEGSVNVSSRDSRYLDYIRSIIARPTGHKRPNFNSSLNNGIAMAVDRRLRGRRKGFFVECGAANGESWSNTLYFEKLHPLWSGLLVEANKRFFKQILGLNRRAYVFGGCLSPYRHPATLNFTSAGDQGGLVNLLGEMARDINRSKSFESTESVYCVPLEDLLAALGVKRVDFLSLDVQGAELAILKTIDFRKTRIDIIVAETATEERANALRKFFEETGLYRESASHWQVSENDIMFERDNIA